VELETLALVAAPWLAALGLGWLVGRRSRPTPEPIEYVEEREGLAVNENGTPHLHDWGPGPYVLTPPTQKHICQDAKCRAEMRKPLGWKARR
jgi:hypothetical protein